MALELESRGWVGTGFGRQQDGEMEVVRRGVWRGEEGREGEGCGGEECLGVIGTSDGDGVRLIVDVCRAEFLLPGLVLGCIMCMSGGSYDGAT